MVMFGITVFMSREKSDNSEKITKENNLNPLSNAEMAGFGISSIEQGDFSELFADNSSLKSSTVNNNDSLFMLKYKDTDRKSIVRILHNNEFEMYNFNKDNKLLNVATIIPNNITNLAM